MFRQVSEDTDNNVASTEDGGSILSIFLHRLLICHHVSGCFHVAPAPISSFKRFNLYTPTQHTPSLLFISGAKLPVEVGPVSVTSCDKEAENVKRCIHTLYKYSIL